MLPYFAHVQLEGEQEKRGESFYEEAESCLPSSTKALEDHYCLLLKMKKLGERALLDVANLTIPSFQVVVLKANLGCAFCRWRVSQVLSNINGLKEFTIDVVNKQVIAKGDVRFRRKVAKIMNNG
ncbi:hypothetical protein ACH5RR_038658 [Cinchona calisaya]|uniref:HMA domain-containing protein n=1 Tax=Cinchona calisaya TaxID=153742 RepID=A0ABD2XYZ8_9GENT